MVSPLQFIATLPHFDSTPLPTLERVAEHCRWRDFEQGETVFLVGERARAFYAVARGRVRLERPAADGREGLVHAFGPGQSFAEAAALRLARYPVSAVATEARTRLVEFDSASFDELLYSEAGLAASVIGGLCQRLMSLVLRLEELTGGDAPARLARHLLSLPQVADSPSTAVALEGPKRELAARLAITPETLSRVLKRWREAGLVDVSGRTISILDFESLADIAENSGPA